MAVACGRGRRLGAGRGGRLHVIGDDGPAGHRVADGRVPSGCAGHVLRGRGLADLRPHRGTQRGVGQLAGARRGAAVVDRVRRRRGVRPASGRGLRGHRRHRERQRLRPERVERRGDVDPAPGVSGHGRAAMRQHQPVRHHRDPGGRPCDRAAVGGDVHRPAGLPAHAVGTRPGDRADPLAAPYRCHAAAIRGPSSSAGP